MADSFNFELVSPERLLVSEQASEVVIPATEGEMTVMARHAPTMTTLNPGVVAVKTAAGKAEKYVVLGGFADIVPGSQCMVNLYSNHHETIEDPATSGLTRVALHAVDALGFVHAMLLRIQVALMPFRTLVFSGGH